MSEELQKLQAIGAQKIHEETHIPLHHVQALLHNSFDGFSKVQFLGFISILEREYETDLSELKLHGVHYFDEKLEDQGGVFIAPTKKKKPKMLYSVAIIAIFIAALLYSLSSTHTFTQETPIKSEVISQATKKIKSKEITQVDKNISETNSTKLLLVKDSNLSEKKVEVPLAQKSEKKPLKKSLKITTKSKVWFGYIDLATNKHVNLTLKHGMSLDPTKSWLLLFGHGYIDIYVNGVQQKFKTRDNIRFLYENGELKAISKSEFKKRNRGNTW